MGLKRQFDEFEEGSRSLLSEAWIRTLSSSSFFLHDLLHSSFNGDVCQLFEVGKHDDSSSLTRLKILTHKF